MKDITDDELDKLFQDAAHHFKPDVDAEKDWIFMERKLKGQLSISTVKRKLYYFAILEVVLAILIFLFNGIYLKPHEQTTSDYKIPAKNEIRLSGEKIEGSIHKITGSKNLPGLKRHDEYMGQSDSSKEVDYFYAERLLRLEIDITHHDTNRFNNTPKIFSYNPKIKKSRINSQDKQFDKTQLSIVSKDLRSTTTKYSLKTGVQSNPPDVKQEYIFNYIDRHKIEDNSKTRSNLLLSMADNSDSVTNNVSSKSINSLKENETKNPKIVINTSENDPISKQRLDRIGKNILHDWNKKRVTVDKLIVTNENANPGTEPHLAQLSKPKGRLVQNKIFKKTKRAQTDNGTEEPVLIVQYLEKGTKEKILDIDNKQTTEDHKSDARRNGKSGLKNENKISFNQPIATRDFSKEASHKNSQSKINDTHLETRIEGKELSDKEYVKSGSSRKSVGLDNSKKAPDKNLNQSEDEIFNFQNLDPLKSGDYTATHLSEAEKNRNSILATINIPYNKYNTNADKENSIPWQEKSIEKRGDELFIKHKGINLIKIDTPFVDNLPLILKHPYVAVENKYLWNKPLYRNTKNGLRLNIMASADLSSVGFKGIGNPGWNIGGTLDYTFRKRWTIMSGVIFSKKNYSAKNEDYHLAIPWILGTLKSINGNCTVIDIPINLRYDILQKRNFSIFSTIGFSTYIMKVENYNYNYWYNNRFANKNWEVQNKNRHYFGIANFSLGFERVITHNLSLQIEPFIKLPLVGVGANKIKITSSGFYFSVRYKLR